MHRKIPQHSKTALTPHCFLYGTNYGYFVGKLERLKQQAEKLKKKWLKGFKPIKKLTI